MYVRDTVWIEEGTVWLDEGIAGHHQRPRLDVAEGSDKTEQLCSQLLSWCITDLHPIEIADQEGFRQLCQGLDPSVELPSSEDLIVMLRAKTQHLKAKVSGMRPSRHPGPLPQALTACLVFASDAPHPDERVDLDLTRVQLPSDRGPGYEDVRGRGGSGGHFRLPTLLLGKAASPHPGCLAERIVIITIIILLAGRPSA
jgi:hypothetical protein